MIVFLDELGDDDGGDPAVLAELHGEVYGHGYVGVPWAGEKLMLGEGGCSEVVTFTGALGFDELVRGGEETSGVGGTTVGLWWPGMMSTGSEEGVRGTRLIFVLLGTVGNGGWPWLTRSHAASLDPFVVAVRSLDDDR